MYVRVSSAKQEDNSSLPTQEHACRTFAREQGYEVAEEHVYRETHTGTELWERRELGRLREVVRRSEVKVVVAYSIDRLSRDPVHVGVLLSEAEHAGVDVAFVTEPLDASPEGQLIRFVRGYAASVEHEKIRERTQRGRLARVKAGKPLAGGKCRYGYTWRDDAKTGMDPHPIEAGIVRRVYDLALAGVPLRTIAKRLNDEAVPPMSGNPASKWWLSAIRSILADPIYCGLGGGHRWRMVKAKSPRTGNKAYRKLVARPLDEQHPFAPGAVPPLVTPEQYRAAGVRLERNKDEARRNLRASEGVALLRAGFIRCGHCGSAASWLGRTGSYVCTANAAQPGRCPSKPSIRAPRLDAIVWSRVAAILTRPEIVAAEVERLREDDPTGDDLAAVDREIVAVIRQQRNLVEQLANVGGAVAALVTEKLAALEATHQRLLGEREIIVGRHAAWEDAQGRLGDLRAWCGTVADNVDTLSYDEKRDALRALDVQVTFWRKDHGRRYEIAESLPLVSTTLPIVNTASSRPPTR